MGNNNSSHVLLTDKFILQYNEKMLALEKEVLQVKTPIDLEKTIFISICNGQDRATVLHETAATAADAWLAVMKSGQKHIKKEMLKPLWIKADIVISRIEISKEFTGKIISNYRPFFMRKGISFDPDFKTAYIEAELNCNGIIDYKNQEINLFNLNHYRKRDDMESIRSIPDKLIFFDCQGFMCDENNKVSKLYTNQMDYGRRPSDASYEDIHHVVNTASNFLFQSLQENGQFIYGYLPIFNKQIASYNIMRHTTSVWTLLNQYKLTMNEALVPKIESAVRYITEHHIVDKDQDTSFLLEQSGGEIKIGGNGVAIVVLCIYMELFHTDCFNELVIKLGNGILSLQNQETGEYWHVLNYPDFTEKEKFRIVYYDGEATFGLCKLYSHTKDKRWLNGAIKAVDYFIEHNYEKHIDHWVAYAVNEITKYVPSEKYFNFGLKNVQVNLEKIYHQDTSFHTYMEMLMITFELYDRMKSSHVKSDYSENHFDARYFIKTIYKRATHMLNGYLYPEYAMYLKSPSTVLGAFCVRHQGYRVRIDDVQHFLGGYYLYLMNYEKLAAYEKEFPE